MKHCVKSVQSRSYPGRYIPAFGLNTEIYKVNLRLQFECGKCGPGKLRIQTLFTGVLATNILGNLDILGKSQN